MLRTARYLMAVALAATAAATLSACGEDDAELLPGETAREITANLDTIQELAGEGDCVGAESAAQQVSEQVEGLGAVDERLKRALRQGADRLNEVIAECEEGEEATSPTTAEPDEDQAKKQEEREKKQEEREKKQEEREKKQEEREKKQEERQEKEEESTEPPPEENGEGKGQEQGNGPPGELGEAPSGGVSPGAPVGEGQ